MNSSSSSSFFFFLACDTHLIISWRTPGTMVFSRGRGKHSGGVSKINIPCLLCVAKSQIEAENYYLLGRNTMSFSEAYTNPLHSTSKKSVELQTEPATKKRQTEPATKKRQSKAVDVEIMFSAHVGLDGVSILIFCLANAGILMYITSYYTHSFRFWHRRDIWFFVALTVICMLVVVKFLLTWRKMAVEFTKLQQEEQANDGTDSKSASILSNCINSAKGLLQNLEINGEWFLWKLYVSQLVGSFQQCGNLINVYLCTLPVLLTSSISFALALECFHTAYTMTHENKPARRNLKIKMDTLTDFLCILIPLSTLWFVYQVPISMPEMLSITFIPVLSMLSKVDDILKEVVFHRSAMQVHREQAKQFKKKKRKGLELFMPAASLALAKKQQEKVPKSFRYFAAIVKGFLGIFFLLVSIWHLVSQPTGCDKKIWSQACVSKIPFCKSLFTPTCNCMSFWLENDKGLRSLPTSLPDEMNGMRKMFIRNCNLTQLPPKMEKLTEMVEFDASFNLLERFEVDILKWEKLHSLFLMHNKLEEYSVKSVWGHPTLSGMDLRDNTKIILPDGNLGDIKLPLLTYLHLGNNSININMQFNKDRFPNLQYLYLNGNTLKIFPDTSLKETITNLGIARCNLTSLPSHVSDFDNLEYLDARDNNFIIVDAQLKRRLQENNAESYFSGNPVCKVDKSLDCEPLCSKYCWSRKAANNGICDITCNSQPCAYDNGENSGVCV